MSYYTFLIVTLYQVLGAFEYLTKNEQIRFFFPDPESITLEYWIPSVNLLASDWLGFGLQSVKDSSSKYKVDLYFGSKDSALLDGFLKSGQKFPASDESLGGLSDITTLRIEKDAYVVYSITRKLKTGDKFDIDLELDSPLMIKTFKGCYDGTGSFAEGTTEKFEYVVLNNYYFDRNNDDFGLYGPWDSKKPGSLKGTKKGSFQALIDSST